MTIAKSKISISLVFGQADDKKGRERPITPVGRRENPWIQNEMNKDNEDRPLPVLKKEEAEEMRLNLENELFGKVKKEKDDDENKYSQVSLVRLEVDHK